MGLPRMPDGKVARPAIGTNKLSIVSRIELGAKRALDERTRAKSATLTP